MAIGLLRIFPCRSNIFRAFSKSKHCSTDAVNEEFRDLYKLPIKLIRRMSKLKMVTPTNIQKECLESLLDPGGSWCSVINAETGSGKTLCFLLPILQMFDEMWRRDGCIPRGSAAILVPHPHLAQQVHDVFKSLANPEWNCSLAAFHHTSFSYTKTSHLLVGIPGKLKNYSLKTLFKNNRILCLDEADTLLVGGEGIVTKAILERVLSVHESLREVGQKNCSKKEASSNSGSEDGGFGSKIILTAATLPSKGSQTVGRQILRLLPRRFVNFFRTDITHRTLPNVSFDFVRSDSFKAKLQQLLNDLDEIRVEGQDLPKVLVFVNTLESAQGVVSFLRLGYQELQSPDVMPVRKWWAGKVGSLFKQSGVFSEERENAVKEFRDGSLRVLICSDLGSRGLDFPDCSAVIQFDFPENSEFFLHRAGRTARAGRAGIVKCYVTESDEDLAEEIRRVVEDPSKSFDLVFSRKGWNSQMLRDRE